jgi:hypothetical protein
MSPCRLMAPERNERGESSGIPVTVWTWCQALPGPLKRLDPFHTVGSPPTQRILTTGSPHAERFASSASAPASTSSSHGQGEVSAHPSSWPRWHGEHDGNHP